MPKRYLSRWACVILPMSRRPCGPVREARSTFACNEAIDAPHLAAIGFALPLLLAFAAFLVAGRSRSAGSDATLVSPVRHEERRLPM